MQPIRGILGNGIEAFGLRDDAAVLDVPGGGPLVVSVDSVVDGVHVDLSVCSPADVGWKALMGALSDLAAMGAAPVGALVALCVPGGSGEGELALGVMDGVAEASEASGCPVVGGDVSGAGELVVAVTVLGTVEPRDAAAAGAAVGGARRRRRARHRALRGLGGRAARAAGGRPGCGRRRGATGGRWPACARGSWRRAGAHAMIDVSDGLALDLHRLADASGVGLRARRGAGGAAARRSTEALGGGEDYELLIVATTGDRRGVCADFEDAGLRTPQADRCHRRRSARCGCCGASRWRGSAGSTGWVRWRPPRRRADGGDQRGRSERPGLDLGQPRRHPAACTGRAVSLSAVAPHLAEWGAPRRSPGQRGRGAAAGATRRGVRSGSGRRLVVRRGGLVTLPARMHEVHTWRRFGAPSTKARTRCTLGFHRRLVRRCEWLTFMPNEGFLPQMSHTDAMG